MTDILRNKDAQGTPSSSNAGGFASRPERPGAAVALPLPQRATVDVHASVELSAHDGALPPYPAVLPPAEVSFSYGDDHPETLYVYLTVDDVAVTVWNNEDGEGSSIHEGWEPTGWDDDTDEEFLAWAHVLRSRLETDVSAVTAAALPKPVEDAIVKNALGAPTREVERTAQGFDPDETPIAREVKFVDAAFSAYPAGDTKQEHVEGFLTGLHHWADANGVDLDAALNYARVQHRSDVAENS